MKALFNLDLKDYDEKWPEFVRPSVRAIIIRDGLIAMIHSKRYNYYKFPGGGIEKGENHYKTLIRETEEESGLSVDENSIREYGSVLRKHKTIYDERPTTLVQENYYYLCDIKDEINKQNLDPYESFELFTLEWISPEQAISANRSSDHGPKDKMMIEREALVLERLMKDFLV